jgi:retron-type reverse transcriptase
LANLFLHYAFDRWLAREFPSLSFERYADDAVIHCVSKSQAQHVLARLAERMTEVGLELHSDKTRIVYCKDSNRRRSHEHERFTFLGYTFGPRLAAGARGHFVSFSPAVSDPACKAIRAKIREWRLHHRSDSSLSHLADTINSIVTGWVTYYGRFYRSRLYPSLRHINDYLLRWAMQKYKRLRNRTTRARTWLKTIAGRQPNLFVHWRLGLLP